jgi:energy-coupling factor transporter ATP-binding protein EcfA2
MQANSGRARAQGASSALDEVVRCLCASSATTVLIDGRSGSGKSTLATQLCLLWADSEVVRLDDIYPGWAGLPWAVGHVQASLLGPRSEGRAGRWRSWDWTNQRPGVWYAVEPGRRLLLEGVGTLTSSSRLLADLAIWVDAGDAVRKRRALRRDGDAYESHWDRWAAQEDDFIAKHDPRHSADLIATPGSGGFTFVAAERHEDSPRRRTR